MASAICRLRRATWPDDCGQESRHACPRAAWPQRPHSREQPRRRRAGDPGIASWTSTSPGNSARPARPATCINRAKSAPAPGRSAANDAASAHRRRPASASGNHGPWRASACRRGCRPRWRECARPVPPTACSDFADIAVGTAGCAPAGSAPRGTPPAAAFLPKGWDVLIAAVWAGFRMAVSAAAMMATQAFVLQMQYEVGGAQRGQRLTSCRIGTTTPAHKAAAVEEDEALFAAHEPLSIA